MSLRVLGLDALNLTYPKHHLKLSVVSATDVRIPQSISSLEDTALVKALTSGKLWVLRGVACHLDIQVLFNGKLLERHCRVGILESLGYRVRDLQLWPQLLLSTSLHILQNNDPDDEPTPDLSVSINHGLETSTSQPQRRAWALDTSDIRPPDSVLCVEFERMQIQFNFLEIQNKPKRVKITSSDTAEVDFEEEMLVGYAPEIDTKGNPDDLTRVVEEMKGLSSIIGLCFEPLLGIGADPDLLQQSPLTRLDQARVLPQPRPMQHAIRLNEKHAGGKGRLFPKAVNDILNAWYEEHEENPCPSREVRLEMSRKTRLTMTQISNWFSRKRHMIAKCRAIAEGEMLLARDEDEEFARQDEFPEEDEMLFSPVTDSTPSLTSRASSTSSVLSTGNSGTSAKRPFPSGEAALLDKSSACDLGEVAIHILISGYIGRGSRELAGIQVEKPPPTLSLASIAPSTFCPGFKKSIAHNAHFLPTVSHAITVSWPRNVQSPSLREKLSRLASSPTSKLTNESRNHDGEGGTTARLAAVVQSRLWTMMQRKVYNPSDSTKIWKKSTRREEKAEDDEYPDLLATLEQQSKFEDLVVTELGDFDEDETDEFEDLLCRNDQELLEFLEERERRSVERETEEILFGRGWDEDEYGACLLDDETGDNEFMLF